ncbi:alanine dehydrogenase/PNT, C-terminal domain protein [Mycobacterium xenopi 4042]|uniref:proton-translocating NAD(P)(+) transhydrogenase n=1 Tax=Mycobacterium xenopi 4042 TaxID=1299334 RepID=X8BIT1_MYCXE|nr:alanine dehydrogenase/PNT, C-terminal domain protein [Mycobacterium xenopi 4042]
MLVLGVGVAGLQALATAKRLGARTTGYDVRPEVADQVRSVGRSGSTWVSTRSGRAATRVSSARRSASSSRKRWSRRSAGSTW